MRSLSRDDLLQPHSQASCDKLPFIIPFNQDTARIGQILYEHWKIIQEDDYLHDIALATPIVAFERHTNIKNLIIHTKFTSPNTKYDSIILCIVLYLFKVSFYTLFYRTRCPYYNAEYTSRFVTRSYYRHITIHFYVVLCTVHFLILLLLLFWYDSVPLGYWGACDHKSVLSLNPQNTDLRLIAAEWYL